MNPSAIQASISNKEVFGATVSRNESYSLDALRAVSAIIVLLGHTLEWFVFPIYNTSRNYRLLVQDMASTAVMIFFVMSGYLIFRSAMNQLRRDGFFSFKSFFFARVLRIWPPLLSSLVVVMVVFVMIKVFHLHGLGGYYQSAFSGPLSRSGVWFDSKSMIATMLLVNDLIGNAKTVSMNGPLWSLSHEFWFYMLGMVLLGLLVRRDAVSLFLCALLCVFIAAVWGNISFWLGYCVWCLGCIFCFMRGIFSGQWQKRKSAILATSVAYCLSAFFFSWIVGQAGLGIQEYELRRYSIGMFTAGIFGGMLQSGVLEWLGGKAFVKSISKASRFSYSLYALHFPLLLFSFSCFGLQLRQLAPWAVLVILLFLDGAIVLVSAGVSRFAENKVWTKEMLNRLCRPVGI